MTRTNRCILRASRRCVRPPLRFFTLRSVHRLVATVIAWGAKFSEHPLLLADRRHNNNQSHIAKTLINRARDLAEDLKVHRIPSADHVVISLLIEPMQNRTVRFLCGQNQLIDILQRTWMQRMVSFGSRLLSDAERIPGYHGFWLTSAIRLLLDLQVSPPSVPSPIFRSPAPG